MPTTAAGITAKSRLVPLHPVERDTVNKIFLGAIDRYNRPRAMLHKVAGEWKALSHKEIEERVTRLAAALALHGVRPGDRVAILSENRPEWAITDFAVLGMGAVDVPLYPTLPANQIVYILRDCGARAVFCSTREQLAKVQEIRAELPDLRMVAVFDQAAGAEGARAFSTLLEDGQKELEAGRGTDFRERALAVGKDEVATLIYTSGTTGTPKGVMLTHYNFAANLAAVFQHGVSGIIHEGDTTLSFLPLAHAFERTVDYMFFDLGCTVAYAESMEKVADNLVEVGPHVAVSVPRLFEKIYTKVTGATGIKKKLVDWARRVGGAVADERLAGREPSGGLAFQYRLADRLVFSKLRARTGGKLRSFVSGGAPLSADIARFFFAAGLPVYEGYGLTETSPVISVNKPGAVKLGTVGTVIPGVEVAIAEGGEILTRGPHVMKGYWNNPDATAEVIDEDGWFHTGDIGELDAEGFLKITDRIKNLLVTAGGKNIAPQPMENLAAMSPFIAQVVMIGDRRAFPSMLIVPDFENLEAWAKAQGIAAADRRELVRDERVRELLEREALGRLSDFARYEVPKKVLVLADEFTIDAGTLTPTLKIKRKAVEKLYADEIERLYAGHSGEG